MNLLPAGTLYNQSCASLSGRGRGRVCQESTMEQILFHGYSAPLSTGALPAAVAGSSLCSQYSSPQADKVGLHRLYTSGITPLPGWSTDWEVDYISPLPVLTWESTWSQISPAKFNPGALTAKFRAMWNLAGQHFSPILCQSPWHCWNLVKPLGIVF